MPPTTTTAATRAVARRAGPDDRSTVVTALAAAFFDDPVFRWLNPDDDRRREVLPAFFDLAVEAFARHDETWCAGDPVTGAAIWAPAGVEPMTEADGAVFAARCAVLAGPDAERWLDVMGLLDEHHPHHAAHDYLWFIGVAPQRRGRGQGGAMLRTVLDRADRSGTPAYLEATSPDNRRLYERHGFAVTGEIAVAGGPPLWTMWREPAR